MPTCCDLRSSAGLPSAIADTTTSDQRKPRLQLDVCQQECLLLDCVVNDAQMVDVAAGDRVRLTNSV